MFQFFVEPAQIQDGKVFITGGDVNHIKNVLRMQIGERVRISDDGERDFYCSILELEQEQIILQILEEAEDTELSVKITLFQGLPKGDKMELVIQKAVELGVSEIIPVDMTIPKPSRPDGKPLRRVQRNRQSAVSFQR